VFNNEFVQNVINLYDIDIALYEINKIEEISIAREDIYSNRLYIWARNL